MSPYRIELAINSSEPALLLLPETPTPQSIWRLEASMACALQKLRRELCASVSDPGSIEVDSWSRVRQSNQEISHV